MNFEQNIPEEKPTKAKPKVAAPGQLLTVGSGRFQIAAARIDHHHNDHSRRNLRVVRTQRQEKKNFSSMRGSARKMDREPGTGSPALNCKLKESENVWIEFQENEP